MTKQSSDQTSFSSRASMVLLYFGGKHLKKCILQRAAILATYVSHSSPISACQARHGISHVIPFTFKLPIRTFAVKPPRIASTSSGGALVNVILRDAHNIDYQQHSIISCMARKAELRRKTLTISDIKGTDVCKTLQLANAQAICSWHAPRAVLKVTLKPLSTLPLILSTQNGDMRAQGHEGNHP